MQLLGYNESKAKLEISDGTKALVLIQMEVMLIVLILIQQAEI